MVNWRQSLVPLLALLVALPVSADWSQEKIEGATRYLSQIRRDWTNEDTKKLLAGTLDNDAVFIVTYGMSASQPPTSVVATITGDDKRPTSVMITGESMLINGHDVTGNLGNRVTYGANSPIIEGTQNSQIAAGSQSSVSKDASVSYSINVSLSVALFLSVAANLYFLWRARRRSGTEPPSAPPTTSKPKVPNERTSGHPDA